MDLDNVIYIIATIVIFVVSLLGQNKKKKAQAPMANNEEEMVYSLNDFEKILERKKEFKSEEPEKKYPEKIQIEEIVEEIPKMVEKTEKPSRKRPSFREENESIDGFDVKSAIIYSSILERKKYRR
ncbi:MAG: hypothetical protein P1P88_22670 [Bacteroidales bacterium]|nr:hypothetical protein [Bacteroidales bacterium]